MPKVKAKKKMLGKAVSRKRSLPRVMMTTGAKPVRKCLNDGISSLGKTAPQRIVLEMLGTVRKDFEAAKNPQNAGFMKKYMKEKFEFLGVKTPERRDLSKKTFAECKDFKASEIHEFLHLLWQQSEREFQYFGLDLVARHLKTLCGTMPKDSMESLMFMKYLITTKSWWDTVDILASKVVGGLVSHSPSNLLPVMDEWIKDENMWLRRTAILHQLGYQNKTDNERLFRYCLLCASEEEFFIRKAIGWALRNYHRTNGTLVKEFVDANQEKLSPLSVKEALKHAKGP